MFDLGLAWRKERIARLGFLVGRDKSADEIATELETSLASASMPIVSVSSSGMYPTRSP